MRSAYLFFMISAILLSGGKGSRFSGPIPKQYLPLLGKLVILHSLEALLSYSDWKEIVIVCEESFEHVFLPYALKQRILFARPGKERQDSVLAGLKALSSPYDFVCIHDGARPLLQPKDLFAVIEQGILHGAATLATQVKNTIKEIHSDLSIEKTLDRSKLWDIQTPQVLSYSLLTKGFKKVLATKQHITDDISLAELLGEKAYVVPGSPFNIKITTKEDLFLAEILHKHLCSHTKSL